ncbi:MAG: L-histidine N(alpha)-methyltransferase [bacterium]|nr:L-histidine N(alpha)-methyltransferase [bacterium]
MSVTLTFHDSQYPSQAAEQLRQGLRTKRLSSKFLYESPAQAQRWLTYHQAFSPSRTEPALLELYQQSFQAALRTLCCEALHYVSIGCGDGAKDSLFLQEAKPLYPTLCFTPLDISAALVIETMLRLPQAMRNLPSFPLVVDLETEPDLAPLLERHETPTMGRLLTCFGMIPNFDYQTFLPYIRSLMRPKDRLLLSANLSPTPYPDAVSDIIPQYDNPLARAWFMGLFESLGFSTTDLELQIDAHPLYLDGHVWQIRTAGRFLRQVQLTLYDESFTFQSGEQLHLFFSNRFTPQAMPSILADAGLTVVETFLFDSREEGIYLCSA